jgi:membrane protease YdiL (CAAX protease family)
MWGRNSANPDMDESTSNIANVTEIPPTPPQPSLGERIFLGPDGLRAEWCFALYLAMLAGLMTLNGMLLRRLLPKPGSQLTLAQFALGEGAGLLAVVLPALVMAWIEKRKFGDYGLPRQHAFGRKFWVGAGWGLAAITALLLILRGAHAFYFGSLALSGLAIVKYALLSGFFFLLVGIFEEFMFRGYTLFTLTRGTALWPAAIVFLVLIGATHPSNLGLLRVGLVAVVAVTVTLFLAFIVRRTGFWPAAIVLSVLFGAVHGGNSGETRVGLMAVVAVALFFCFTIRRTGDLWFAVGFHMAWDWGESYLYGVADSGQAFPGKLMNSSSQGPAWLSGGSVGPEGSYLVFVVIALMALVVHFLYPARRAELV